MAIDTRVTNMMQEHLYKVLVIGDFGVGTLLFL